MANPRTGMDELSDESRRLLRSFATEDRPSFGRRARIWHRLRSPTSIPRRGHAVVVAVLAVGMLVLVVVLVASAFVFP